MSVIVAAWVLLHVHGSELVVDSRAFLFTGQCTQEFFAKAWVEAQIPHFRGSRLWPADVRFVGKVVCLSTAGCTAHTAHIDDEQATVMWETEMWEQSPPPT